MKNFFFYLLASLFFGTNIYASAEELSAEKIITAITQDDFNFIQQAIESRKLSPNEMIQGKTLLIHAVELDKAEMVNLLVRSGARLDIPDTNGYTPMEIARKENKVYALAELIVITS